MTERQERFRVVVTGSRRWVDHVAVADALTDLLAVHGSLFVAQGGAYGADRSAERWTRSSARCGRNVIGQEWPAPWEHLGRPAGPTRNEEMLFQVRPHLVVAFKDDLNLKGRGGTEDCCRRALAKGIPVRWYRHRLGKVVAETLGERDEG